ncbi:SusC/RagA family TonB-linked outer membrane protein [Galbibacter mesophilus]|uniref:SusC/RagA family TonB-linked outer membrane protein n=1 Tax=Galbibacter mesophilus TaxID=379069 RepID=UPI00191FC8AC|nr:SusC/RagA family TonB-linked outer membrane protein [Galbibacter mesophilus]MCM5663659.1 SusC/RagA family TonB-linked outer membrane protein [Galbibacter mesophilus]
MQKKCVIGDRCPLLWVLIVLFLTVHSVMGNAESKFLKFELAVFQHQISGVVSDKDGIPISGVHIQVKGTSQGTFSNSEGAFAIVAAPSDVLTFSYIGFKTLEKVVGNAESLTVVMQPDIIDLGEVTVNAGYYTVSERERTGNISSINAVDIEKQPVNNPLGAMQGYMSGVNIVQNSGVPGGGYDIQIRGRNFINGGTEPLYIVDGVPYGSQSLGASELSAAINQGDISPLNAINPTDIESIEVLKDADATAIYGSRGANGVVLITTKKGKSGVTRIDVNLSSSLGRVSHFLDLMDTDQYLEIRREGIVNDGFGERLDDPQYASRYPELLMWDQDRYTDWQKELIGGTAYRNIGQLSISGGSDNTQFLLSGAVQNETTVFPGDPKYGKVSVHSNINHRSNNDRFGLQMTVNYTKEHNQMPRTDLTRAAYRLAPNAPELYDDDGQLNWENNSWDNPLASLLEEYDARINTLIANVGVSYKLLSSLTARVNFGYNTYQLDSYKLLPNTARNPRFGFTPQGYSSITTNESNRDSWIVEPQLQWQKEWGDFGVDILLGSTFQKQTTEQLVVKGTGFPNNGLIYNLAAASQVQIRDASDSEYNYQAFFGRLNLTFKERYILNITGRRDGSSRFGPDRQYGNFVAIGGAWLFSEEPFLRDGRLLSFGKLRGSYGTTGSDNIGDYQFLDTYNVTGDNYNGVLVLEPSGIFNPLFGWEVNKKLELALELGFFNDRVLFNTAWYRNRSSNQLIGVPLAATTGFNSLTGNFDATVENTGLEIDFRTMNIRNKDFQWKTTFNITVPKNKLVEFPDLENSAFASRYIIGEPLTITRLYNALGVDPQTGMYTFEDYNNDGEITSLEDRQWIEDLAPKFYGGLGNTFTYKNLSLDIFFQFKSQKNYNHFRTRSAPGLIDNNTPRVLDRWQEVGDVTTHMMATSGANYSLVPSRSYQSLSNAAISDATFLRLRNVSLSYRLPMDYAGKWDVNLYLQGQNLWTWTQFEGPDPEQFSLLFLPPLRQITLGAQIGF